MSNKEPTERLVTSLKGAPNKIPVEKEQQEDHKNAKEKGSSWGFTYSLSEWLCKWQKREVTWPVQQGACLDEKDTNGSSTCKSFPGVTYLSGLFGKDDGRSEANVQDTIKTRRAKRKGKPFLII